MNARKFIPSTLGVALVAVFMVGSVPAAEAGGFFFGFGFGLGHRFHRPYYRPHAAYSPGYGFYGARYYPAYSYGYYRPAFPRPPLIRYSVRTRLGRVYTSRGRSYRDGSRRRYQGRYRSYEPRRYYRRNNRKY